MKRKSLLFALLLALFMPWAANAQNRSTITIGDGTSTQRYPLPGYYGYQYDVYLYTPSAAPELGVDSDISSIAFYVGTNNTEGESSMEIWVKDVDANYALAAATTFDAYTSDADLVYENEDLTTTTGWNTFNFRSTFSHVGGNALLVAVRGEGCGTSNCSRMCTYTSVSNTTWYKHQDTSDPGSNVSGYLGSNRANIQLELTYTGSVCFTPSGLTASNVTDNSATLSWNESGEATSWTLEYGTASDYSDATQEAVRETPEISLSRLSALTTYYVRVKADCGSDWLTGSFSTTAEAEAVGDGWSDDFEGETCGWELINGDLADAWVWGTATNNGGTHAIYISDDGGTTWNYSHNSVKVFAAKLLSFTEGKFTFSYDWNCYGESNYDFLRVALVPASQTLTAGSDYSTISTTSLPTGWIALDGGKLNQVQTWQNKEVTINVSAGNYYLVFAWRSDSSTQNQPPAAVDNVSITKIACEHDVTDLSVSNITTTGATLSWEGGEARQWQVVYSTASNFENAIEEIVDNNAYDLTRLDNSTIYYVKVRAYCGGEDYGSWSETISFATACESIAALGYSENFDSYEVSSTYTPSSRTLPICWNYINECTNSSYMYYPSVYYYSYTDYSHSSPNSLRFYSYYSSYGSYDPQPQYAILPPMEDLAGLQVTLMARGYNASSTFKIGTMSNPTDPSTFTLIAEQDGLTTAYPEEPFVYLIPSDCRDNYLAIMIDAANSSRTYNGVFIDDIVIREVPSCAKPTGLTVDNVTAHEADLTWTSDAASWVVQFDTDANFTNPLIENVTNGEASLHFRGLDPETTYYVHVQAICDISSSEWSNTVNFTTTIACPAPTNLTVTPDLLNATFTWESNAGEWEVAFATDATAEPEEFIVGTVNEATYTVRDLELDGDYYFWVRANCGNEDGDSQWAGPASVHIGYCVPAPSNVDGNGISNVTFGMGDNIVNNDTPKATYADYSSQIGAVQAGVESTIAITYATGYTYGTIIWVDLDNSLSFEDSEIVYTGTSGSANPTTLNAAITIPATQTPGDYMMRIGGADSGFDSYISNPSSTVPSACYNGNWACFQDYTLRVLEAPSCLPAGDVTVDPERITSTSAVISWTNNNGAEATYTVMQGETVLTTTAVDSYELTGLTAATSYPAGTFTIISNCDETAIANVPAFSTLCDVITDLPWSQNFEGFNNNTVPMCWDNSASTSLAAGTSQDYYIWGVVTVNGNNMIKMENYWAQTGTALINTPTIELPAEGAYQLSFDYAHNASCGAFAVNVSTDDGTTFTELASYTKGNGSSHTEPGDFTPATISLADYAGESIILQFFANANYGNGAIFVDNIKIQEAVTVTLDILGVGEDNWIGTNNSGYYLIASPMMNTITPSANNGFITDDFDLYYFDEGMEDFEWRNYHVESFDIVPGKGYIYASKTDTQLQFTGVPNTNGEVTLTLQKTDGNAFEGWNLVGNPFNQTAYLPAGHTFYTMDYDQNLIVEVSQGDERNIEAMQAVFVVAENDGETITFTTTAPEAKSAIVALNLNNRNGLIDRAIIRFDEGSTMPKLQLKRNSTKLYIPQDGNDYAVVRSEGMGAMPVNFKAESNGSYTITLSTEEVSFAYLHLIDKVANTDVDLLANPSYSFDALTTDFANRFELVFATSNCNDDNFAFFNNGSFVINNSGDATLQVIDVNGRVLTSESINGCANVNVNAAAGVYMIRLVNGDNVKVQKVVVR